MARGQAAIGRKGRWLDAVARRVLDAFPSPVALRARRIVDHLLADRQFIKAIGKARVPLRAEDSPGMRPAPGEPASWTVPAITTPRDLAAFCGVSIPQLEGLADCQGRERRARREPLRNYRYRFVAKASGGSRLIESPKPRLKAIQRRLLDEIVARIPPHDAAHGFRPGRSVLSFVAGHAGRHVVLKMDLADFFPSITAARVQAIFMTAGYPEDVALFLAGLCTNVVPIHPEESGRTNRAADWHSRRLLAEPHLPQGAPTSPALANLAAFRLDVRLATLARAAGARYTRYADDLVFSGDDAFVRSVPRFSIHVAAIVLEEGFDVRHRKTRIMRRGIRQRAAGLVLNEHPNVPREDYDALKATLHNCVRYGPASQNRAGASDFRAHLLGRIAHVASVNPHRGLKLRASFDRISW